MSKLSKLQVFPFWKRCRTLSEFFKISGTFCPVFFPLFSGKKWVSVQYFPWPFPDLRHPCIRVWGVRCLSPHRCPSVRNLLLPLGAEGVISRCKTWEKRTAEWHQSHGDENICRILRDYFSSFVNKTLSLQERGLRPSKRSNTL